MASKKKNVSLIAMQTVQQQLIELAVKVQMESGTSSAWKHLVKAGQHCTLALLHSMDPEASELAIEAEKLTVLRQYGAGSGAKPVPGEVPPLVKKAS